jgi:hypothetical protein
MPVSYDFVTNATQLSDERSAGQSLLHSPAHNYTTERIYGITAKVTAEMSKMSAVQIFLRCSLHPWNTLFAISNDATASNVGIPRPLVNSPLVLPLPHPPPLARSLAISGSVNRKSRDRPGAKKGGGNSSRGEIFGSPLLRAPSPNLPFLSVLPSH